MTDWREKLRQKAQEAARRAEEERGCPDKARARIEAQRAAQAAEKAAHEKEEWRKSVEALEAMGLREREISIVRAGVDFAAWPAAAFAREWLKGPDTLLALVGVPGTGKTVAGAWAVSRCRFRYHHPDWGETWCWPSTLQESGLYVLCGEVATLGYYGQDTADWRRRLIHCRLLVVDELGTEVMSPGWQSLLDTVVDQRHRARRKTLLAGNLDALQFAKRYGDRVARRVTEDGRLVSLGQEKLSGREEVARG